MIRWNTDSDKFEQGQWFHGHVYVGRSDLSPDGSLLIYFANKFNRKTVSDKEYTYAWTAISRPPDAAYFVESNKSLFMRLSQGTSRPYLLLDQRFSDRGKERFQCLQ